MGIVIASFEIPKKISQNLHSDEINLKLHVVDDSKSTDFPVSYTTCSNVEVSIKPHMVNDKIKSLEFINVYIDDLNLMHQVKTKPNFIKNISVYLKKGDATLISFDSLIQSGEEVNTKIIKTNLSPKTHPPVIDIDSFAETNFPLELNEKYTATLTEFAEFSRILWEGLTTNNGGYYLMESVNSELFDQLIKPLVNPPALHSKEEIKIVFSFESDIAKPFYGFNNFIKMSKDVLPGVNVFGNLKMEQIVYTPNCF